jgi:hypothetical protein
VKLGAALFPDKILATANQENNIGT